MRIAALAVSLLVMLGPATAHAKGLTEMRAKVAGDGWSVSLRTQAAYDLAYYSRLFLFARYEGQPRCRRSSPVAEFELGRPVTVAYRFWWLDDREPQRIFQRIYLGGESGYAFFWGEHPAQWCSLDAGEIASIHALIPQARPDPVAVFWGLLRPT